MDERAIEQGLAVTAVSALARQLDCPVAEIVAWLQISSRTWARRKVAGVLDPLESDRLARLGRLHKRATRVLGGVAEARTWLTTPNRALERRPPLAVAQTEIGAERVFALLGRLEHGVFT